jgi:hypothetical protein
MPLDDLPADLADSLRQRRHDTAESEDEFEYERRALDRYMARFKDPPSSSTLVGDASDDELEAPRGEANGDRSESPAAASEATRGEGWELSLFKSPRLPSGRDENEGPGSEASVTEGRLPSLIPVLLDSPPPSRWGGSEEEALPSPIARRVPFAAALERAAEAHRAPPFFHRHAKRAHTPAPDGGRKVQRLADPGLVEDDTKNENVRLFKAWYRGLAGYTLPGDSPTGFEDDRYRRSTTSLADSIRTEELESIGHEDDGSLADDADDELDRSIRSSPPPWPIYNSLTPPAPPRPDLAQARARSRMRRAPAELFTWAQDELRVREELWDVAGRRWRHDTLPWNKKAEAWFALGRAEGRRDQAAECADRAERMMAELDQLKP